MVVFAIIGRSRLISVWVHRCVSRMRVEKGCGVMGRITIPLFIRVVMVNLLDGGIMDMTMCIVRGRAGGVAGAGGRAGVLASQVVGAERVLMGRRVWG